MTRFLGSDAAMTREPTPFQDPIDAFLADPNRSTLAIIAGVDGPSYRPVGAMMTVLSDSTRVGNLSSGCIDADIALHAMDVSAKGTIRMLRYGSGSPFFDIELPCGGGLDILLVSNADRVALSEIAAMRRDRQPCSLQIDLHNGKMRVAQYAPTSRGQSKLNICFSPPVRFLVFGKGLEASTFASLVQSAGYSNLLLSPDAETRFLAEQAACTTCALDTKLLPSQLKIDAWTAVVLFFHDHDWEPPLLAEILRSEAFYVGAQGSMRARDKRLAALAVLGVTREDCQRLHGPIGLIPSARDPVTLAVSVLAEVLTEAKKMSM